MWKKMQHILRDKKIKSSAIFIYVFLATTLSVFAQDLSPVIEVQPGNRVEVGEEVYFSATSTTYPEAHILAKARYEWDFGDGYYHRFDPAVVAITRSGIAVVHYFMKPGDFTVTLKVTIWANWDAVGNPIGEPLSVATTTQRIYVTGEAPMAGFEIQRAPFHNRLAQYLYVQIPEAYRENTTTLKVTLQGAKGYNLVLFSKDILLAEEKVFLDHKPLPEDDYVVVAELLDSIGKRIQGGLWRDKFSKKYSGIPKVGIDENNFFRLNGDLYFPVGPFMTDGPKIENYIVNAGVNMLHTEGYYATHTPTTWSDYLEKAEANALFAIGPGRGDYPIKKEYWSPSAANRWRFNHNPDRMAEYVQLNKNNSSIFSWAWQDEPNLGGRAEKVYPATIAAWAYVAHREDAQHPTYNLLYGYDWSKFFGQLPNTYDYFASPSHFGGKKWIQDAIPFDIYPLQFRFHPTMNFVDMGPYAAYLDALKRLQNNNKDLVPVIPTLLPCNGQPNDNTPVVTEEQVYLEAWMNVINGAKGILWFPFFDQTTIRWPAMKKFADQMKVLTPIVLQAKPDRDVADDANNALNRVDTMIREYEGAIYIFAARITEPEPIEGVLYQGLEPKSITVALTVSGLAGNAVVDVLDEGRQIPISDGRFIDTFAKNAVHIYKVSDGNIKPNTEGQPPKNLRIDEQAGSMR